jgi:hypothetical protein
MNSVRDILQEADPLRHEPDRLAEGRNRLRQAVLAAGSMTTVSTRSRRTTLMLTAAIAMLLVGIFMVGLQMWARAGTALHAAVRFEVRMAEERPAPGLREARVAESDRVVYLHQEVVVTNGDVAASRSIPGDEPSRFHVTVEFTAAGARKMREATASHLDRPIAILVDDAVVAAPVLRSPISTSAVITGNYSEAEADRIVEGIR